MSPKAFGTDFRCFALLLSLVVSVSAIVASPDTVQSDISVLIHNDLYGELSVRKGATLVVHEPKTIIGAISTCAAFNEVLWTPTLYNATFDGNSFLGFLAYNSGDDRFWISSTSNSSCRTISASGRIRSSRCTVKYPVLCTQSAPASYLNAIDTSEKWQVTVNSAGQRITGFRDKYSFRFQGIRYASQPERFTHSTPYHTKGNFSALAFSPPCMQRYCPGSSCSEDCLFLNIWSPRLPSSSASFKSLKPILVWFHGGAFTGGTGSDPTFDGSSFVSRGDVVVVTVNYRLSTLGFLVLDDGVTKGNFGIGDQITALEWLKVHAKDFGGDPERITVAGQSAGAASVRALLGSPRAKGLFHAGIMMSSLGGYAYATTYSEYYSLPDAVTTVTNPFLEATGCTGEDKLECLRGIDALEIQTKGYEIRFVVQDGEYVTYPRLPLSKNSTALKVPMIIGWMRDDGAAMISYPKNITSASDFIASQGLPASLVASSSVFPLPSGPDTIQNIFNLTARIATDAEFRCLGQATAYAGVRNSVFPNVWVYEFDRAYQIPEWSPNDPNCKPPPTTSHPLGDPAREYFKCHSGDLLSVFGTLSRQSLPDRDDHDIPFSQRVLDSFAAFVRTHDPNPDPEFLEARGFVNTMGAVEEDGRWVEVEGRGEMGLRMMALAGRGEGGMKTWREREQCEVLGLGNEYYL
ncbi:cholinesterase [Patellaria atrata CBS 101060]|uniref:Carboxylic ester hydrolase n=1 Tax=Patellaria atrata CBS 101060 TaxID=1346257 RepID=A0A9P4S8U2_9PEZI|nr:cholinesterase [Patellaria atrata CBS 101060]